jgi:hypothetical protein
MLSEDQYYHDAADDGRIWQRYCGFLDLSLDEYMRVQETLLMGQIDLVADTVLGRKIMEGNKPKSVAEFRQVVPVTTYSDYQPYLTEQTEDVLSEKPSFWVHTSGRGGDFKWVPYTSAGFDVFARYAIAACMLGAASSKGDVNFRPGNRMLLTMAPRPYSSGSLFYYLAENFTIRYMPSMEEVETLDFGQAVERSSQQALRAGVDSVAGISSVLVKMGERISGQAGKTKLSPYMLHPMVLFRLLRGLVRSKIERRPMLPRDLWSPKALLTGGGDSLIYKDALTYYWGQVPHEIYVSSELMLLAMQSWNKKWMTFLPHVAFWEFIPEEEWLKTLDDASYQPSTVLFNELEAGKSYELVFSHFYGMPLLRYRIGDLITVAALKDDETGVNLPQIVFKSRADGMIDLAGMTKLDEKTVWRAIANTGLKYEDWAARKEYDQKQPYLHLYIELKEPAEPLEVERLIDEQLKALDVDYRDVDKLLEIQPIKVTLLSQGTCQRYFDQKKKEGAHMGHLKPPHMNPSDGTMDLLIRLSQQEV